jgi:hypothetical protein
MTILLSALSFGFLGSLHCVGMCGGFAGALTIRRKKFWTGLLSYQLGRIFTYSLAGLLAGISSFGLEMVGGGPMQKSISVLAGAVMIILGLNLTGLIPDPLAKFTSVFMGKIKLGDKIQKIINKDSITGWLGLGMVNGFLPCGLVYAAVFMSLSAETPLLAVLVMAFFGLGTIPAMMFAPSLFKIMTPGFRLNAVRFSGILLIVFGVFTIYRGTFMKQHIHNHNLIDHTHITDESCDSPYEIDDRGELKTRP